MRTRESESLIVYISLFFAAFGSLWLAWQTFVAVNHTNQQPQSPISNARQSANEQKPREIAEATAFRDGVNSAMEAATRTQVAKTPEEWANVANLWQQAIENMGKVPETDLRYATAQQKRVEYQKNLEYAQKRATRANTVSKP